MELTDFLLARIAEREEWAQEALDLASVGVTREWRWVRFYGPEDRPHMPSSSSFYRGAPAPEEVLAECEAKRRIVGHLTAAVSEGDRANGPAYLDACKALGMSYAEHPDYRESWRP